MADRYFGVSFTDETRKVGRQKYLEWQITVLSGVLKRERGVG